MSFTHGKGKKVFPHAPTLYQLYLNFIKFNTPTFKERRCQLSPESLDRLLFLYGLS